MSAYENRLRDLIIFDPTKSSVSSPWGQPDNVQIAKIRGIELEVGTDLAGWDLTGAMTWLDPRNRTPGAQYGNLLNRRSRLTGRVDADKTLGQFRVGASVNGAGARYTRSHPPARLLGCETHADRSAAAKAEYRIKQLSPAEKRRFATSLTR